MKKLVFGVLAAVIACAGVFLGSQVQAGARSLKILEWQTMVGVPLALTGAQAPIRGLNGGGLPWVINGADGELSPNGKLELKIVGLVFDPSDPSVIARGLANKNTVPAFRAVVSCLAKDGSTVNVMTDPFPATTGDLSAGGGNASIEAQLTLPKPCIAPIVFVTSPTLAWFATTGN
jgi:hypothetical protein